MNTTKPRIRAPGGGRKVSTGASVMEALERIERAVKRGDAPVEVIRRLIALAAKVAVTLPSPY